METYQSQVAALERRARESGVSLTTLNRHTVEMANEVARQYPEESSTWRLWRVQSSVWNKLCKYESMAKRAILTNTDSSRDAIPGRGGGEA